MSLAAKKVLRAMRPLDIDQVIREASGDERQKLVSAMTRAKTALKGVAPFKRACAIRGLAMLREVKQLDADIDKTIDTLVDAFRQKGGPRVVFHQKGGPRVEQDPRLETLEDRYGTVQNACSDMEDSLERALSFLGERNFPKAKRGAADDVTVPAAKVILRRLKSSAARLAKEALAESRRLDKEMEKLDFAADTGSDSPTTSDRVGELTQELEYQLGVLEDVGNVFEEASTITL